VDISAILLARSIAIVDINDLNPRGQLFFPALVPLLVEKFAFQTFPSKKEEFNAENGIVFADGYFDGQQVNNLTVYSDGIKIETRSSTSDGRLILIDALNWLKKEVGLNFSERMITRWGYVSQLTFHSDVDLVSLHPALSVLSNHVSSSVSERVGTERKFMPYGFFVNFDRGDAQVPMANFNIERRNNVPLGEGKYFSAAPLETDMHIEIIQEFEGNVRVANEGR
jgi:hypothetical protein